MLAAFPLLIIELSGNKDGGKSKLVPFVSIIALWHRLYRKKYPLLDKGTCAIQRVPGDLH